ncbi:MAG: amidase [Candidatus Azotimanducaceae bacterium]|jgi:amidase
MDMMTAVKVSKKIRTKTLGCEEYMKYVVGRIDRLNPEFNAIVAMLDGDDLIALARTADAELAKGHYQGWLHGMPYAVKDLANVAGFITSFGSPIFANNVAQTDDVFVSRIRAEGAIVIGKTNVPEFGLGSQSYNPVYGATCNAFNGSLTAGGSSGGAAVALATGMLPVADGSDMMGSLRNPAAYNNVVGFRPSLGRVPKDKQALFFDQLPIEGPMGRTVEDVICLFETMAGADAGSPLSQQPAPASLSQYKKADLSDVRIGWLGSYDGYLPVESGLLALCEKALAQTAAAGGRVEAIRIAFDMDSLWQTWLTLRHWFVANSRRALYANDAHRRQLKPELIWEIEQGAYVTAADVYDAGVNRSNWFRALNAAFAKYDILALPSAQVFPFDIQQHWPTSVAGRTMDTYHRWMEVTIGATLSGCPVISLPAGFDAGENGDANRAMGIQFIAPIGKDRELLEFALAYQDSNNWFDAYPDDDIF